MSGKADLKSLATQLLTGRVEQSRSGKLRNVHLEGTDEQDARLALARLLRSRAPLDREIRIHLANLFDPKPEQWEPRTIKLVHRTKGRSHDAISATQIAQRVHELRKSGESTNSAIGRAAKEFSRSDEAVKKIWKQYRRLLEVIDALPTKGN
jgi:hypothetical protein